MALIEVNGSRGGTGVALQITELVSARIPPGTNGTIISATAEGNSYLKLTDLFAVNVAETSMTLVIDGKIIFSNLSLDEQQPNATGAGNTNFMVTNNWASTNVSGGVRILEPIVCKSFSVVKTGNTINNIDYAYLIMEPV